jgi:hypothetical protein
MLPRRHSLHYSRNLKAALIISLTLIISIFYFAPDFSFLHNNSDTSQPIIFSSNDVPPTVQSEELKQTSSIRPHEPAIVFNGNLVPVDILKDVYMENNSSNSSSNSGIGNSSINKTGSSSVSPFIPRQILEVIPKKVDENIRGIIKLSLKIGKDGKVVSYIVLLNTTDCSECLKNVIAAIHKSEWEPASVNGNKIEYWIEKSYKFN